jgi:mono/diheme cytochrome c family protein
MRGPDLSRIAANPDKTVEWIADHIRDPKLHNERSRMPAFAEQLADEEIVGLAQFLVSLNSDSVDAAAADPADNFAAARELFSARCQRCHSLGGAELAGDPEGRPPGRGGRGGRMRGPDLSRLRDAPEKTVEWIADHIRDPKLHNERSRMPAFAEQLSDEEIVGLAEFLANLQQEPREYGR